jgi:GntR family transcriptional regulator
LIVAATVPAGATLFMSKLCAGHDTCTLNNGGIHMSLQSVASGLPGFAGPLYVQVAGILRAKIFASEWTPRAPLPNEVSLARDIGVSIGTVRKALEMLENEHLIHRRQGRGTFVVETSDETELERFSNLVSGLEKLRADPLTWTLSTGEATSEEANVLMLPPATKVHRLEALWSVGDKLKVFERITVEEARFPGLHQHLGEGGQFLFPIYRRHYQVVVNRVSESLTAENADETVASRLDIAKGQALMRADRTAFDMQGRPVEWSRRYMHLARCAYAVMMS